MTRICLTIEYDGSDYAGWQIQPNAVTVQACVEAALERVVGSPVRLYSSGRTDAGVHAAGMKAHFDVETLLPLSAYREGVNRALPSAIVIREAVVVADNFNARFDACGKWYQYQIYRSNIRSPLHRRISWQLGNALDLDKMIYAAQFFVGKHDFNAFRSSSCVSETSVRELYSFEIVEDGEMLLFNVRGRGFLKNMVRILVGTLVDVGIGRLAAETVEQLLLDGSRQDAGRTAPAHGLCLMDVWYEKM
ncbi:MAG: tRNA pseudouridine(38-40) synthase TruA [Thermodesulfobacteriota bacterium]|nr:tRNA pseudouridine(38-40) synthase TruA [Thermodesulfobacteriota bacterium]